MPGQITSRLFGGLGKREGALGILFGGHRSYVGGRGELWEKVGRLQFDFLVAHGLRPEHVLLDVACGALRGGVHFIPYLNRGNYLGMEKERMLIRRGIRRELGTRLYEEKAPELVVSGSFEFDRFSKKPDFVLAQSLFTHLTEDDIRTCFARLRGFVNPGTRFFATYFVGDLPPGYQQPRESLARQGFWFPRSTVDSFGSPGWRSNYIGEWGHPRNQMMVEYTAE